MQLIGVDTGGTFTDAVLVTDDGRVGVGKAMSTPGALERGVLASMGAAAADVGLSLEDAVAGTRFVAHGTTAGLNALLTGNGAQVGLLTTESFEATVPMARANNVKGIDEKYRTETVHWEKPPLLMSRRFIRGVRERIDADGGVVTALDEAQAREQIAWLAAHGVEAVGICLLWGHVNPTHERRLRELVAEQLPDVPVTLGSELAPRIGEYERSMSVVLNAYVAPLVAAYLRNLEASLRASGFNGSFLVTKSSGGIQQAAMLIERPIETLNSGPVGGLVATAAVGRRLGHENIVATDVGGTSFDVGLVAGGKPRYVPRPMIGRYSVASPVVDIVSIGTGGGSIAWLDHELGSLRVGPASAGADPGPACYGRGGTEPTVTDAAVALGYLDQLGQAVKLDAGAAVDAIEREIASPLGITVHAAAEGILEVAASQMADLVRRATIMRGHDPSEFVLYAYGGAAPQYVGRYAREIGVRAAYVPGLAAVFSAFGAVSSDFRAAVTQDVEPRELASSVDTVNQVLSDLEGQARHELSDVEVDLPLVVTRHAGLRFFRQVHELQVPLPDGPLDAHTLDEVVSRFHTEYEKIVGKGTIAREARVEVVNLSVDVVLQLVATASDHDAGPVTAVPEPSGEREAWFGGAQLRCPVYEAVELPAGQPVQGPAFVEMPTTTLVVYPGQSASIDHAGHIRLDFEGTR
jgi:N-methylhydantoinase A